MFVISIKRKQLQQTFTIDRQWLLDHVVQIARWQHPAVGCQARSAVTGATCFALVSIPRGGSKRGGAGGPRPPVKIFAPPVPPPKSSR